MTHPYASLDDKSFWASAVARRHVLDIDHLWQPKGNIKPKHKIATFGSCFAQHIGRALAARGYGWLQTELPPHGLKETLGKDFNYGVFTARTGNIYTVTLLKQWTEWALGESTPPEEVWEKDGRYYDPFRPQVEPDGFSSPEEVRQSRLVAIDAFRDAIKTSDIFVFTMGLTESWFNKTAGYEYPMCPGTVAGTFDADEHLFVNQDYMQIQNALQSVLKLFKSANPKIRVLLTVSPVPLTATNSGKHVLVATMHSKSVLRAVAGHVSTTRKFVDYFPSYEIINSAPYKAMFFETNLRSVSMHGVNHVMTQFFAGLARFGGKEVAISESAAPRKAAPTKRSSDVVCEEELLGAFGPGKSN